MIDYFADDADVYHEHTDPPPSDMVDRLAEWAHDAREPRALEFAIGTGRVALPLAQRGVGVRGNDTSPAMLAELGKQLGECDIIAEQGDMRTHRTDGDFPLVFLVYNTIMNVTTQRGQAEVFTNAARHLAPGGRFVVEVSVPDLRRVPPGSSTLAFGVGPGYTGVDEYTDFAAQQLTSHHVWNDHGVGRSSSVPFRWVWPSELDLMAQLAGLVLEHRWADWDRTPFTGEEPFHISVWRSGQA